MLYSIKNLSLYHLNTVVAYFLRHKMKTLIMYKYNLIFVFFLFIAFSVNAQINKNGLPFVQIYTTDDYQAHEQNWAIVKDNKGVMYFANNYGLLQYNGTQWNTFENPHSPYLRSLETDKNGRIYYGASSDFGIMMPDSIGSLKYVSISKISGMDTLTYNNVWNVHIAGENIYFQAYEHIFKYKLPLDTLNIEELKKNMKVFSPETYFHWSFSVNDKFYVREAEKGLFVEENDSLIFIEGSELFAQEKIYVMLPYNGNTILIITRESGVYIYDPSNKEKAFVLTDFPANELLVQSYIYGGTKIKNNLYAVYTLANGIIIFDEAGNVINHYNKQNCLPSSWIQSIFYDKESDILWFTTDKEIGNLNLGSPFRKWPQSTGIEGTVSDMIRVENILYVSDNTGVYYLSEDENGYARFYRIEGIDIAVWDLEIFYSDKKDILLAATEGGVFSIEDNTAKLIDNSGIILKLKQSVYNPQVIYIGYLNGFATAHFDGKNWALQGRNKYIKNSIIDIYENNESKLYLGTDVSGVLKLNNPQDSIITIDSARGLPLEGSKFKLFPLDNELIIAEYKGLFLLNQKNDYAEPFTKFGNEFSNQKYGVLNIVKDQDAVWLGAYSNEFNDKWQGVIKLKKTDKGNYYKEKNPYNILPHTVPYVMYLDSNDLWIANAKGVFKFNKTTTKNYQIPYYTIITKVSTQRGDSLLFAGNYAGDSAIYNQSEAEIPVLSFRNNNMIFEYAAGFYEQENRTEYSYRLLGFNDQWSKWTTEHKFTYTNIHEGDYTFQVKARNIYGNESKIASYRFTVLPPWYRTVWAYVAYVLTAIILVWLIVRYNTRRLKQEKERLEQIVAERTREIKEQHDKIAELHKSIMDSIFYARRIQEALLPPDEILSELLPEYFVLFKPRDIVSGDFYWATEHDNRAILVAADCTGHGVPGAFMSMLGISYLNEIVNKIDKVEAHIILNELRANVKKSLRQTGKENEAKDGMDIALCIIDYQKMQMEYAGAFNSLYLIRDGELIKYNADRMPIGIYIREKESFTKHIVPLQKGDCFYIFSDGFVDQFGGPKGTKLMTKRFKELLLENYTKPMSEQKQILDKFLQEWQSYTNEKGETYRQIDDILVIGVKIQ